MEIEIQYRVHQSLPLELTLNQKNALHMHIYMSFLYKISHAAEY